MEKSEATDTVNAEKFRDKLEWKIEKLEAKHQVQVWELKKKHKEYKKSSEKKIQDLISA